jgi:phospholipid/cholesterol/gamma-HCH transport system ATP-binding protein
MAASPDTPPRADGAHVVLDGVRMGFGDRTIFESLSCRMPKDKITVILGGSGVGKSTVLRLIGGLIRPDGGHIQVDGTDIVGLSNRELARQRTKLGMMFQGGALLDSMNVFDNLAFPLREHTRMSADEISTEVRRCLLNVGLIDVGDLLPGELSGGMVKRVALARALIRKPVILLCDEPFSGLDPITTKRVELLLKRVNQELGITVVMISHDASSTLRMADHLLVMLPDGAIEGSPDDLKDSSDPRVANLLRTDVDEAFLKVGTPLEALLNMDVAHGDLESTWS